MTENYERLIKLLKELFQIDRPDLDFGIYRIMNQKRDEITTFLDKDLLPQVQKAFASYGSGGRSDIQAELDKMVANLKDAGIDPDSSPKVQELKDKLNASVDVTELENEVYSHLYNFFRRYYKDGDFLSLRRYKKDVYAIPYEGEEVKLHWANADQYYIKSSENFRDYTFKLGELPDEGKEDNRKTVHFKLVEADTELANNKAQQGKERRFVLCSDSPMLEEDGELIIRFEYKPLAKKQTQKNLNESAVKTLLSNAEFADWVRELAKEESGTSVLAKHLNTYTAKNSFDYFIHKDLGGFLRRELDFFIKNEVMHLDDIEEDTAPRVEQYLSQIKVLRLIAHKIIRFLEQLENFQKKLWLKKKFVVETNYCITLDRVPEELYPEICANDAQREEWVRLFRIDNIKNKLATDGYSNPLKETFLKQNRSLVLDTKFFSEKFKTQLQSSLASIDEQVGGFLIGSDNFHAIQFIANKYKNKIKSIYIDPPYNTDASSILYKNDYKESSWATLLYNRISLSYQLLSDTGNICVAIDDDEVVVCRYILQSLFEKRLGVAVVRSNPQSRKTKGKFAPTHEYALFYGKSSEAMPGVLELTEERLARYPLKDDIGNYAWMNFIRTGNADLRVDRPKMHYPIYVDSNDRLRIPKMHWDNASSSYIVDEPLKENESAVYPIVNSGAEKIEKRWHRGFERVQSEPEEYRVRRNSNGSISIDFKTRIDSGSSPSTWWNAKEYASANYGAAELKHLFGQKTFDFPKALTLVQDCIRSLGFGSTCDIVFDFFGGSGTTAHALISLNRINGSNHKYIVGPELFSRA